MTRYVSSGMLNHTHSLTPTTSSLVQPFPFSNILEQVVMPENMPKPSLFPVANRFYRVTACNTMHGIAVTILSICASVCQIHVL